MFEHILAQPFWIKVWIFWMIFLNAASVCFVHRREGRMVLLALVANAIAMNQLYLHFGYTRILGLSHLVFWTPLVVWLFRRRASFGEGTFGGWARLLVLTNAASLAIDAVDVARFAFGDRAPL